ncbi:MAG: PSP1 C-terminal domain-containing protein [Planctomycetaceae bacterium]
MPTEILVRYGTIPEVARFDAAEIAPIQRGEMVLVNTHRGMQLGEVLDPVRTSLRDPTFGTPAVQETAESLPKVIRRALEDDLAASRALRVEAEQEFGDWQQRIIDWNLELELIDLEWTFDRKKLILYVLNERGPDCTKLALQAAAAGLGIIEVQPVNADGLVTVPASGGCSSCGAH